jgi:phage terminase large subunit
MMPALEIQTPRWALPLLGPKRYKGAKGGRGSGKSHFFAEAAVEEMAADPYLDFVCIREIQKSLKFSAKKLIEDKIRAMGLRQMFEITDTEIRRKRTGGHAVMIFQGMQDHTADSIKSLEGFGRAWAEEAHSLRRRSMELLLPTIRAEGSELWFSWNPDDEEDPVETLFRNADDNPADFALVHVNYTDNPWMPDTLRKEAERCRLESPNDYGHIWLGEHKKIGDAQILKDKWVIEEFEPGSNWEGPYHGLDFGFANDPTAATKSWIHDRCLFIEYEAGSVGLELDDTPRHLIERIPGIEEHTMRADNSRPESISFLRRNGLPLLYATKKWPGSVKDGIGYLRSFRKIVVHPRCTETARECRLWSYKVDPRSGDILPIPMDLNNHYLDSVRYGHEPMIGREMDRTEQPDNEAAPKDAWGRERNKGARSTWKTM